METSIVSGDEQEPSGIRSGLLEFESLDAAPMGMLVRFSRGLATTSCSRTRYRHICGPQYVLSVERLALQPLPPSSPRKIRSKLVSHGYSP